MNIQEITNLYLEKNPYIKNCLKNDLINLSKLSRKIIEENSNILSTTFSSKNINNKLSNDDFDAILIALRRIKEKISLKQINKFSFDKKINHNKDSNCSKIKELMKKTSINVENKIIVVICENFVHPEKINKIKKHCQDNNYSINIVEGFSGKTIITNENSLDFLNKILKSDVIKVNKKQIKITLISPENLENIPGVIANLYSLLAENDINITETMSCFKDTIIILNESDLAKTLELLD
jgi:hypothetical protein